ncbi:MAG: hypothetical protein V3W41_21845 [Planctomycetota bacterium]
MHARPGWWREPKWRRHHRVRSRVRARRTEYELSWECVERRKSTGDVAWESPIGGRIVRMGHHAYMWRAPDKEIYFVPRRRIAIELGKQFATEEQLRVVELREAS